jgi:hypothetical protein
MILHVNNFPTHACRLYPEFCLNLDFFAYIKILKAQEKFEKKIDFYETYEKYVA